MEGEHQLLWAEGPEELKQHHGQHRARLGEVDGGVTQPPPCTDEFPGELNLAPQIVRALERQTPQPERPDFLLIGLGGLSPHLGFVTSTRRGPGNLFGERRDTAAHGVKFMGNEKNGGNGGRNAHAQRLQKDGPKSSGQANLLGVGPALASAPMNPDEKSERAVIWRKSPAD